jgi:hypothetical protein
VALNGKKVQLRKKDSGSQEWWIMPVIPTTWEAEIERSLFNVSPGKS